MLGFISPDDPFAMLLSSGIPGEGTDLYAYCLNDPVNNTDPSGCLITELIIGLFILTGAALGGYAAYSIASDYGATGWELAGWTALGVVGGGIIGGIAGHYLAPTISSFMSSSFILGSYFSASGELVAITVTGAQIAGVSIATVAGLIMFASDKRPGDNQKQNEQYREAMRRLGYNKTDWQWRYGHDHLPKKSMGFKELLEFLRNLFGK